MGKKYIIELLDKCNSKLKGIMLFGLTQEKQISVEMIPEESMTPYTEPDLDAIRNEAYEKGVQDTKQHWVDTPRSCAYQFGYKNGLNDAWKAARKIASDNAGRNYSIFGQHFTVEILNTHSASECIEKIRQYEQEKEEQIQIGDEVISPNGKGVVTEITDIYVRIMYAKGSGQVVKPEDLTKTGRHFPAIATVLQKMREEPDGFCDKGEE